MASLVFVDEITFVFSARQPNGWKLNINEFVIVETMKHSSNYMNMFMHILLPMVITQVFFYTVG